MEPTDDMSTGPRKRLFGRVSTHFFDTFLYIPRLKGEVSSTVPERGQ